MSSFIGHSLIAAAIGSRSCFSGKAERIIATGWLVFLAISPDLDYLLYWFFNIQIEPRFSHSVGFCAAVAFVVWRIKQAGVIQSLSRLSGVAIFAASFSHLLLDGLVGVHPMPLCWPFSQQTWVLPVGVLPSAGHLSVTNYYLWRNLAIELGILLPVYALITPHRPKNKVARAALWLVIANEHRRQLEFAALVYS